VDIRLLAAATSGAMVGSLVDFGFALHMFSLPPRTYTLRKSRAWV
jgi:hypothetical protein